MIEELQQLGSLSVAHRAGGAPVELVRSKDEVVFLAFDNRIDRLVELHVLRGGSTLDAAMKRSAFDRARQASEIHGHAFMRILEVGEDQGLLYYTSNLNDGEFVEHYTQRRGAVVPTTALALVYQLLEDLLQLEGFQRLVSHMHLDRVLVTTLEDTFLQLRVFDYGLSQMDKDFETRSDARLVVDACRLIFLLLTGQPYAGENPDRFPALTQLPMGLRTAVRAALTDPLNAPASVEKLRDDVREAFSALSSHIKVRSFRKHLVVNSSLLPQSQLQELLLEDVPVEAILGARFRVEDADHARRYPFSIPAIHTKLGQPATVHLLPPSRIVDKSRYEAVPLQIWRFNPERHPNILRSLSLWESPDWTFLTEEREPGFALSRLMAERITLNPAEVTVLMRQVRAGLDQAVECGVQRVDLHPSNILLQVGKNGPLLSRELERLMQKRLDAWPSLVVKLRPHMTMRSLYEPLLVDMDLTEGQQQEEHLQNRDFRHRSFVALAGYLLTGERQSGGVPQFPESIPEAAADYVRECLELIRGAGKTPSPGDFIDHFEKLLSTPTVGLATRLRGSNVVALEEMENVGSVSDFDDDWNARDAAAGNLEGAPVSPIKLGIKKHDFNSLTQSKHSLPWGAAAAAVVLMSTGAWILMGGEKEPATVSQLSVSAAKAERPAVIKKDMPSAIVTAARSKPVEAAKPQPAPVNQVAVMKEVMPTPAVKPAPVVVEAVSDAPLPPPSVSVRMNDVKTRTTPVLVQSADSSPKTAAVTPAPITPQVVAVPVSATTAKQQPEELPITIRRAILPSKEEIDRVKQGLVGNKTGRMPAISTASHLPSNHKNTP